MVQRKNPISVVELEQRQFLHFKALLNSYYVFRKVNTVGEAVTWLKIKWMQYRPDFPGQVFYKHSYSPEDNFKTLDLRRKQTRKLSLPELTPIANSPLPLSAPKMKDLKDLLPFIHTNSRPFYEHFIQTLTADPNKEDFMSDEELEDDAL